MEEMCRALHVPLVVLESPCGPLGRGLTLARRSWCELRRARPRVLIVQNPSIVLTTLAVLWRPLFGYRLVVDAHNEAVRPHIFNTAAVRFVGRWLLRAADLTIVTNIDLADTVTTLGGRPMVLHDRVPDVEWTPPPPLENRALRVAVISTFAPDEPLTAIFEAARLFRPDVEFFVTGRTERGPRALIDSKPQNVRLTGFLEEMDYWDLLRSVHAVVDLTAMPDCLVCGSYEAIAVGRPLVLTDIPAARALFGPAALFTRNEPSDIGAALRQLRSEYPRYAAGAAQARASLAQSWDALADTLVRRLQPWLG
jgi:glycosyltransferase involved in cell wall biosynthesis